MDFFDLYNKFHDNPAEFAKQSGVPGMTESQGREIIKGIDKIVGKKLSQKSGDKGGGGEEGRSFWADLISGAVEGIESLAKSQESGGYFEGLQEEMVGVTDAVDLFYDRSKKEIYGLGDILGNVVVAGFESVPKYLAQQTKLLEEVNKGVGLTGKLSENFREEITKSNPQLLRMGISFRDLAESATKLVQQTGRFALVNQQTFERAGVVATAYVGTLQDLVGMYPDFEKIGLGAADAGEAIGNAGKRSLELGLSSQKVTRDLASQLGKLNEYGFRNGVRGLEEMVRKSIEFRTSMDDVTRIAERVFDPEKAVELSANLQVLGGAIGDFNDPLKLMYMATNNVEGLQDALIGAASSLATYNQEQGRFEITGVNLRRAKAMAGELGMTLSDLSKTAIASAERASATGALLARGLTLDDDQQRFITNLAQMKGGKMTIELQSDELKRIFGANEVALEDLDQNQADLLLKYQEEFKKLDDKEIVRNQATNIENIRRDMNFLVATARLQGGKAAETAAKLVGFDFAKLAEDSREFTDKNAAWINSMASEFTKMGMSQEEIKNFVKVGSNTKNVMTEQQLKEQEEKKKTESQTKPTEPITQETLKRLVTDVYTQAKYMDKQKVVINNNIEDTNPNSYLQIPQYT